MKRILVFLSLAALFFGCAPAVETAQQAATNAANVFCDASFDATPDGVVFDPGATAYDFYLTASGDITETSLNEVEAGVFAVEYAELSDPLRAFIVGDFVAIATYLRTPNEQSTTHLCVAE